MATPRVGPTLVSDKNCNTIAYYISCFSRCVFKDAIRGVTTGVTCIWVYIPPKSVQVNFLWGRNDIRMAIEHAHLRFIPPQKFYTPPKKKKNKFLAMPLDAINLTEPEPVQYFITDINYS